MSSSPNHSVVVLTGATRGIGYEVARSLASHGYQLILPTRSGQQAENVELSLKREFPAVSITRLDCDLTSLSQVRSCCERIAGIVSKVDVLINNAGVMKRKRELTSEGLEVTWVVNCIAPWLMSRLLIPLLSKAKNPRIVQVNSEGHRAALMSTEPVTIDWDNLQGEKAYKMFRAYSQSKLGFLLLSYELDRKLKDSFPDFAISVNSLHPGVIKTDLGRELPKAITATYHLASRPPSNGASAVTYLATAPELYVKSGLYFDGTREVVSSKASYDQGTAEQLWEICCRQAEVSHDLHSHPRL